jgi:hypothetical protein
MAVPIKITVSWLVTPYSLAKSVQRLERAYNLHFQEQNVRHTEYSENFIVLNLNTSTCDV